MSRRCARCGAEFLCGMDATAGGACWCMALPHLAALPAPMPDRSDADPPAAAGCWCRACLEQHIAQRAAAASGSRDRA